MWINLEKITAFGVAMMLGALVIAGIIQVTSEPSYQIVYDCREANVSLDFPIEVKHRCEKLLKRK